MQSARKHVVESNIPAAIAPSREQLGSGLSVRQRREMEDITTWMELQEEAEVDLLMQEIASCNYRQRHHERHNYD